MWLNVQNRAYGAATMHLCTGYATSMPAIVIGADTPQGVRILEALANREGDLRAFVSTPEARAELVAKGIRAANGDVSDGTHVGSAAIGAFCAVCISTATHDDRERSFASTPAAVVSQWAEGLKDAGVRRIIWVSCDDVDGSPLSQIGATFVSVDFDDTTPGAILDLVDADTL